MPGGAGIGEPPSGWPPDLPHPEALSPANAKEADDVSDILGPYSAAALYSKVWQLREAGLNQLERYLGSLVSKIVRRHGVRRAAVRLKDLVEHCMIAFS